MNGGNSGTGSTGDLSFFKATIINDFIEKEGITSILDFGCGDGQQISRIKCDKIIGIDPSKAALKLAIESIYEHPKEIVFDTHIDHRKAELSMSLDVLYHLISRKEFEEYLVDLFDSATKFVIIYSSNFWFPQIYHQKGRRFTAWVEKNKPSWTLFKIIKNPQKYRFGKENETSISDFYFYRKS